MPWPISTIGITNVTSPLRSIRMKAFGANSGDASAAAQTGPIAFGRATLRTKPPPKAAPTLRKSRRPCQDVPDWIAMISLLSTRSAVDGRADALVGATAADVAGHGSVNVAIAGFRRLGQERRG